METRAKPPLRKLRPPDEWLPFRGLSWLFDNPAEIPPLYRGLAVGLAAAGLNTPRNDLAFCPLPPESYHVTALDGCHERNLASLPAAEQAQCREFLDRLPAPALPPPAAIAGLLPSARHGVCFELLDLALWGRGEEPSLAARLRPDAASSESFRRFLQDRDAAAEKRRRLGLSERAYEPHVTLGYFHDPGGAARARERLADWQLIFAGACEGATAAFGAVSLHAFESMARFIRLP